jgi:ABC-2 type transport system permease protein
MPDALADVWTVAWKEFKEYFANRGGLRGGTLGVLLLMAVISVFLPLQAGKAWVESPMLLVYWAWVPLLLVTSVIADSFAGERERHTLGTLLASRTSDTAILFGKIGAGVGYGWGFSLASLLLALVTVNIAFGHGRLLVYSPPVAVGIVGLSLLGATLAASAGVLVSLRAATVKQAQQILSMAMMLVAIVPLLGLQALSKQWQDRLARWIASAGLMRVVLTAMAVLAVLDALLLAAAKARFKRARLILD